jgi:hypothetical protein
MDELIERAAKRTMWASKALAAASNDLADAGAQGLPTAAASEVLELEAQRLDGLAGKVAALEQPATRVRDLI